jgi:4-hydroxy-4-methyl-2-oxoglutarate aldolase
MNITNKIIDLIGSNRISSTEVADALGKQGALPGFKAVNNNNFVVGELYYIYAFGNSNWSIHEQIRDIPQNAVIYVDAYNCEDSAIFGDLVSKYILLYKKAKGIIVNGMLRDIPDLRKYNFSIWCKGFTPIGCFNKKEELDIDTKNKIEVAKAYFQNSIVVCDDTGCTIIEKEKLNNDTFSRLEMIELQEDIWSYCINTLKWSTYDTICMKKYLLHPEFLPEVLREKVKLIPFEK